MEENQTETPGEDQDMVDQQHDLEEQPSVSHDFEDNHVSEQNHCTESSLASESSHIIVETIESELPGSRDGESLTEPKWLQGDDSVALWVKWRGKWQAGIRCARDDWPLSTLKAKPTHDRKKYFVIFFPHTRNYSWADMLLVRSIHDLPQPIAYRSHKSGLKLVKDLSIARHFIMRKLAIGILNIIDQFHTEAFVESARDVQIWKEFAAEVSHSNGYPDLGKMLLKLQSMILPNYMNSEWLQQSLESWSQRCQNAANAESVEMVKEELYDSILWSEVNSAPIQPPLGSEWKSWKNEVMKWFSIPQPVPTAAEVVQQNIGDTMVSNFLVSRKRPKLEIRRAEVHACPVKVKDNPDSAMAVEIASEFFKVRDDSVNPNPQSTASPSSVTDRWDDIVVAGGNSAAQSNNSKLTPARNLESTPVNGDSVFFSKTLESGSKTRQCTAFIESKGRQCVRSANEGDVYCCVHLASRFLGGSARSEKPAPVESPMCGGTTVLGTKCKHRSLPGFTFCKKHRPRDGSIDKPADFSESVHRRKHHHLYISTPETAIPKHVVPGEEDEDVLHVNPISVVPSNVNTSFNESPEPLSREYGGLQGTHCIGLCVENNVQCTESPKRYSLYCDTHLPSWLKRARNGKSRIVSKEVFLDLLRGCSSDKQKVCLHQACELFFKLFKSILSLRNPVPMEVQLQWAVSEAAKDIHVGEFLMKLVCSEVQRLRRIWGFGADGGAERNSAAMEDEALLPWNDGGISDDENMIKCKICSEEFLDDEMLGEHWMDSHKKEAQWLFRGYACAICLDSYTNKKILESHVQERHHVQFVEQCKLLQCIPCSSHFGNTEELWFHVLSVHSAELRLSKVAQRHFLSAEESPSQPEPGNSASLQHINGETLGTERRFICRFCGLKFNLLPDLGRHHQAAHKGPNLMSRLAKRGIRYYAYKLKSGRLSRPKFKKGLGAAASYRIRNRGSAALKKQRMQVSSKPLSSVLSNLQPHLTGAAASPGSLTESQCSVIAKVLFSDFQKTTPRPSNREILSVARFGCCKESIRASLERVYGELPERVYLKAAKLCSEQSIAVNWHLEGFVCPNGCKPAKGTQLPSPLVPPPKEIPGHNLEHSSDPVDDEWEVDESHYVIDMHQVVKPQTLRNAVVLCNDISFGRESVPVVCVFDEWLLDILHVESQNATCSMPWESFTYIERPLIDHSVGVEMESLQLGCLCSPSACNPEACDHVYLFDNDYEDAKDIHGRSMRGRFPYNESGRIILEEGYLVYECNHMCSCSRTCPNRVLQNGVRVKLEVFKTDKKGWAVRAGETISRGTFICEYIGEVLDDLEADNRRIRYGEGGCSYLYEIKPHINDMSRLIEAQVRYIIDSTQYGNVSRFINHSCSPNLVNHQVLVESMDCQRAHIGLYASQDINIGEELTYDFRYEELPGGGVPCQCGASNCRGRLY